MGTTQTIDNKERFIWIDILKVIACIGVILIHFTEKIPQSPLVKIFTLLPRTSVQIFFLVGGVTLYRNSQISITYFLKKFVYLLLALVIFRFVYYIYHQESVHFWQQSLKGYWHLWYLYTIIPIYALSGVIKPPILSTQKEVFSFIAVILMSLILFSTLGSLPFNIFIPGQQNIFSTLIALLYILLGYGLSQLHTYTYKYMYMLSIVFYVILGCITKITYDFAALYLLIPSICLFLGVKNMTFPTIITRIVRFLAPYTLFAYGFHVLWIYIGKFIINGNNTTTLNIILYFIFVVGMSFISSFLTTPIYNKLLQLIFSINIFRRKNAINNNSLL